MASVSFGLNRGALDLQYGKITIGTLAVSTNDVEVRIDQTKNLKRNEIAVLLEQIKYFLLSGQDTSLPL